MTTRDSVIAQLQTRGEDAIGKLAQNGAARAAIQRANSVKERVELLLGLESVESRLTAVEARLSALEAEKPKRRTRARSAAARESSGGADGSS